MNGQPKEKAASIQILGLISASCFAVFAVVAFLMYKGMTHAVDHSLMQFAYGIRSTFVTYMMIGVTEIGSGAFEVAVCCGAVLLFVLKKERQAAIVLTLNLAGAWLLNDLLKEWFARVRPDEAFRLVEANSYSFPSGHAMVSAAFYGMLAYLLAQKYAAARMGIWVGTVGLVLLIGLSRVYLGVHFISDVAAGFVMGAGWLIVSVIGFHALRVMGAAAKKRKVSV